MNSPLLRPAQQAGLRPSGSTLAAVAMFVVLLASYSINAMDRQIFPLLAADVRHEYGFGLAQIGLLSTIFTLGMAIAGAPTGFLLARLSRRSATIVGIAIFSIGTVLTASAHGFAEMLLYRAATGIGEAMQLTVIIAIGTSYFTRFRSTAVGAVNFSFGVGAIIGPVAGAGLLAMRHEWRFPMIVFGLLGFAAIVLILIAVRPWFSETRTAERHDDAGIATAHTLWNRNTILLTVLSLIGGLIIYGYLGMYPTFLREHLGFTPAMTGRVMSAYGFGVFASIAGGWIGDRLSARKVLVVSFLIAALLGYGLFYAATTLFAQALLSFVWGLVVSGVIYVNLAGYHIRSVSGHLNNKASGVFVSSLYGSASIAGYTIGWLATSSGWSTAGLEQISLLAFIGALLALALQPSRMALPASRARETAPLTAK
ncbi:MFS transporter [Paraburkholderia sp. SARCC-3016]|uniref:MFS transporter n=1 Tax=Paraburkholderia sp. SARCC-3016 TaxID=3058611 RepID=UPI0028082BC2|nr:MFS transporter [Paraburkholderia sp. SARCC-3016]MDQ7976235.1 MFS transporter [Paraburkholderia sp. SARCC-3016]